MMRILMNGISIIFHPLLLATYLFMVFYKISPEVFSPVPFQYISTVLIATFVATCVIPGISIVFLKMTSRITNFELTNKEERYFPFFSIALFYSAATYMFITKFMFSPPLSVMMIVVTSLIILLLVLTFWIKISIHSAAIWSMSGLIAAYLIQSKDPDFVIVLAISAIIAGLVGTSRLYLGRHQPSEVWTGSLLGFAYSFILSSLFF